MGDFKEVQGDLIKLALEGQFDVIAHGCNCFCTMGAGLAPQMAKAFNCDKYTLEDSKYRGDINKLGQIEYGYIPLRKFKIDLYAVNCYTQYGFGSNHEEGTVAPVVYEAITLCMRKINHIFKGKRIGLPLLGCHLAGGDWNIVKQIFQDELKDCDVTVVHYKP